MLDCADFAPPFWVVVDFHLKHVVGDFCLAEEGEFPSRREESVDTLPTSTSKRQLHRLLQRGLSNISEKC